MKQKFTDEEKKVLVEKYKMGDSVTNICIKENIPKSTFYTWIKLYDTNTTEDGYEFNASNFYKLRRKVAHQAMVIEILQKLSVTVGSDLKSKLYALEEIKDDYPVRILCEALMVDRGTFYNHIARNKKKNNSYKYRREYLSEKILEIYEQSNQIYGAKKIKAVLEEKGIATSDKMVGELMEEMNIKSIRDYSKRDYIRFNKEGKKDSLNMNFKVNSPNEVWVSDTSYYRYNNKKIYICVIIDLYARKVIAYTVSKRHSSQLINSTFKEAFKLRQPTKKLIFHSDRGAQYTSYSFRKLLNYYNIEQSFSPTASPYHNAVMESFFATLKKEELYRKNYISEIDLKDSIHNYMIFYNNERPHATIKYKTPNAYETLYFSKNKK